MSREGLGGDRHLGMVPARRSRCGPGHAAPFERMDPTPPATAGLIPAAIGRPAPMPSHRSRAWPVALGVACAAICLLLYFTARATVFDPTLLPGHDGAGYIQRGMHIRDALAERDFAALFGHIFRPDIRPPVFPFVLGLWQLARGDDLAVAIEWSAVAFFLSLVALVALGTALDRRRGWIAGLGAAVLTAMGLDHLAMTLFPMSETTTLLATILVTLGVVRLVPRPGWVPALGIGGFLLLGALVRYNLPLPLLAALLVDHVWTHRRSPRDIASPHVLLWVAPIAGVFALWQIAQPNLLDNVEKFLVNRSSGLEFWSAENLLFVPRTALAD